jgi:hypothetical protein
LRLSSQAHRLELLAQRVRVLLLLGSDRIALWRCAVRGCLCVCCCREAVLCLEVLLGRDSSRGASLRRVPPHAVGRVLHIAVLLGSHCELCNQRVRGIGGR